MAQTQAVHLDCITAPHDGLNPSVILTATRAKGSPLTAQYVFNVPDAVSRFCLEHKLRPGLGLRGVFVTGTGHELHGLPGLVMRLRGDGHGAFELFGPGWRDDHHQGERELAGGPVQGYVRAMPNVCSWKAPAVLVSEFSRDESGVLYEDEHVRVWPMWSGGGEEGGHGEEASADPRAPWVLSRADILEQLRSLAPPRGAIKHAVFGRRYRKRCDVTYGDVWVREEGGTAGTGGQGVEVDRADVRGGEFLLGYACYVKGADELVVISGYADDVSRRLNALRRHWLVRHCADRRWDGGSEVGERRRVSVTIVVSGCVHDVPLTSCVRDGVAPGTSIREIMLPVIGRQTRHNGGVLGFDSTAKTAARLHLLCPHTFPAPYAWKYLRDETERVGPDRQPQNGAFRVTLGGGTAVEGAQGESASAMYIPYVSESRISSTSELRDRRQSAAVFLDALEDDEKRALAALRKKIQEGSTCRRMLQRPSHDSGSANAPPFTTTTTTTTTTTNQSAATTLRQRLLGGGRGDGKRKRDGAAGLHPPKTISADPSTGSGTGQHNAITASDLVAPHVLFLGTGSAEPSKYRGPSGILVKIPYMDDDYLLMECGEGTFGQLVRMFGYAGALDRLSKLRCVWISHRHADHMSGLVELLSQRAQCAHVKESELLVLGPKACVRWVRSLQPIVNLGRVRVEHFGAAQGSPLCRQVQRRIGTKMIFTPVHHCHDSFAVSLVFGSWGHAGPSPDQQFKLVYSGDTEPCEALVRDGQGADMIIHEATFEHDMVRDARAKRHSTIREALDVARRAGTARVILTHFSQRYPKFPKLEHHDIERSGVAVAFDGFAVPLETEGDELSTLTQFVRDFFHS